MTTVTRFVWDELSDCVLAELDETNAVQAVYTNESQLGGGVVSQRRGGVTSTLHADALGTTRAVSDPSETVTDTYVFDAWGNEIAGTGSTVLPYKWVGRYGYYQEATLGLVVAAPNVYSPGLSRWLSDSYRRVRGSRNTYVFYLNTPLALSDTHPPFVVLPPLVVEPPRWPVEPPIILDPPLEPQIELDDVLKNLSRCSDDCAARQTWTKADCPCPCDATAFGSKPADAAAVRQAVENSLRKYGIAPGEVTIEVKAQCIDNQPGLNFAGISVTCGATETSSGRPYICIATNGTDGLPLNMCSALAISEHESLHVLHSRNGTLSRRQREQAAYKRQCETLFDQRCCANNGLLGDALRGCYREPFAGTDGEHLSGKDARIRACVKTLIKHSYGGVDPDDNSPEARKRQSDSEVARTRFCNEH